MEQTKPRTAAEMIAKPQAGDVLRKENGNYIVILTVTQVGKTGAVSAIVTRITVCNGYETTQIDRLHRKAADWKRTNFSGYDAA